jgi:hypothetical protein
MKYVVLAMLTMVLAFPSAVSASNTPHPTLDRIASEVAGKPVAVWCEDNASDWDRYAITGANGIGANVFGFTFLNTPVVYLSPQRCIPLRLAIDYGYRELGIIYLAAGLHTLTHEAVHQRGITAEGAADCTALPLIPSIAERYFGVSQTIVVQQTRTVARTLRRKIAGKWRTIRYTTQVVTSATVPNPEYQRLAGWALAWHRLLPANYQGC